MSHKREEGASAESQTALERPPTRTQEEGPESLPEGTVLAGRYEVRKLIGRGGMGVVVEAFDAAVGVSVAIKVVRAEYAGERQWTERLAREVKLARRIQHPNVCRVFDFAQSDGRALLIMELASGGALRSQLLAGGARARPLSERLADARAIAAGVAAIHAAGIVHRDLSPQNVLRMADGRLVVSDFGLATDAPDGTTSIHGGTVAYMAPEVLRGGRASFAADIWSLGAVIHEVVFGERMRWDPKSAEMRSAIESGDLSRVERSVLEICRACTTRDPARRPRDAGEIGERFEEAAISRAARLRWGQRAVAIGAAVLTIAGGFVGARRVQLAHRRAAVATAASVDPLMIVPTGEPDDWTDKAKVLAEVPAKPNCVVALPDRRTVRFVWGHPRRAEDLDTRTGERKPSPLVPEAYAEGCPDLSRDGRRLVYAGHTADDRAFAFVSPRADGRNAVPEVQIGEPGTNSDPVWLPDGEVFVYDADDKHVAAFSTVTKHSLLMPTASTVLYTSFHQVVGNRIFVTSFTTAFGAEVIGFDYPQLNEVVHWRLPSMALDVLSIDAKTYYCSVLKDRALVLTEVDPAAGRARFVGNIPGQSVRYPIVVDDGLLFGSTVRTVALVSRTEGEQPKRVSISDGLVEASACGPGLVGTQIVGAGFRTVWIDAQGKTIGSLPGTDNTGHPRCTSDGKVVFRAAFGNHPGIERCEGGACRMISAGTLAASLTLSRDEKRLALVSGETGGRVVSWISTDGVGGVHDIIDGESGCAPIWTSGRLIWVSLRKGRRLIWTEIDTDSERPTGRTAPGSHDCTDGVDDPQRPLHEPVEIEINDLYQLRLLPAKYLSAGSTSR